MNFKERFLQTMRFGKPDRIPYWDWGPWTETVKRWHKEGFPEDVHLDGFFGFDRREGINIHQGMLPPFDEEILEETEDRKVWIDSSGVKKKELKEKSELSMPQFLEFPVKNRADFQRLKKRFNAKSSGRYPIYWEDKVRCWKDRDYPLSVSAGSIFGWARGWMGLENLVMTFYDDPTLVHEMFEFIADFVIETITKAVQEVNIDYGVFWEDMAFKTASLISPKMFREFMLPRYKRITNFLRKHNIDIIMVDSDGNIDELIPLWLEGGVNCVYPLEVAAGMDAVVLRKKYGRDLTMSGNIDKRALAKGPKAIEEEIMSKVPYLLEQGGFIPTTDHTVPPDVPFQNYVYFRDLVRKLAEGK